MGHHIRTVVWLAFLITEFRLTFSRSSKATIEAVKLKSINKKPNLQLTMPVGKSLGKFNPIKMFPMKKSNGTATASISRVWKIPKESLNLNKNNFNKNNIPLDLNARNRTETETIFSEVQLTHNTTQENGTKTDAVVPVIPQPEPWSSPKAKPFSSTFMHKSNRPIYNSISNPVISPESWNDLNLALGDEEMKVFLSGLPFHVLQNLTTMTRISPEVGQKQLIRMILDQSDKLKPGKVPVKDVVNEFKTNDRAGIYTLGDFEEESKRTTSKTISGFHATPTPKTISGFQDNTSPEPIITDNNDTTPEGSIKKRPGIRVFHYPTLSLSTSTTTTTPFPVLESPTNQVNVQTTPPETGTEADRERMIKDPQDPNSPRQLNSITNAGYFLPSITTLPPVLIAHHFGGDAQSSNVIGIGPEDSQKPLFSWQHNPQDPDNTFQPYLDKFMKPPLKIEDIQSVEANIIRDHLNPLNVPKIQEPPPNDNSNNFAQSSVWLSSPKDHPFSGFHSSNIKLLHSAASDTSDNNEYTFYEIKGPNEPKHEHESSTQPSHRQRHYKFSYSTVEEEPPKKTHAVGAEYEGHPNIYGKYEQSPFVSDYQPKDSNKYKYSNDNDNDNDDEKDYKYNYESKAPPERPERPHSPAPPSSSGIEHHPESYGPPHHEHDGGWGWGGSGEWWGKMKDYFDKGEKSKAEKVFEITLGILSFIAFAGYLFMLLYQVFAVSAAVPLFPLLSTRVPQNPTVFGLLLGRGFGEDGNLNFLRDAIFSEKYIDELEHIVKGAMGRVKETLSETGKGNSD